MISWVLALSVRRRWYVLLFTVAAAVSGALALTVLPIDAVPDVTNVQVQINAFAPALSNFASAMPQMLVAFSYSASPASDSLGKERQIVIAGKIDNPETKALLKEVHRHLNLDC